MIHQYLGNIRLELDRDFIMERFILDHGVWEAHVVHWMRSFLLGGGVCVDVGASGGYHTLLMAELTGENGTVYAFEPSPLNISRLCVNIALNPVLSSRIVVESLALSDKCETLKLFQAGEDGKGNAYVSPEFLDDRWNAGTASDFTPCETTTLDKYFRDAVVHFLKIDVEGMELEVLKGGAKLIARCQPIIIYETLGDCFDTDKIKAAGDFLMSYGYELRPYGADTLALPKGV